MDRPARAQILTVGDELLSGAVVDTNLARIGRFLRTFGVEVVRAVSVGDCTDEITHALRLAGDCDLCVVSGGLGPTSDDRTAAGVAQAAEVALVEDADAWQLVQAALGRIATRRDKSVHTSSSSDPGDAEMRARNRKQALLPVGAKPIANARGTAPGFELELPGPRAGRRCWVVCLPGVPRELTGMLGDELGPRVHSRFGGQQPWSRTYRTLGVGESWVATEVEEVLVCARKRAGFSALVVHYLATSEQVLIVLELPAAPPEEALAWLDEQMLAALSDRCFGIGLRDLATRVVEALAQAGLTVATADACTGGQMGVLLTGVGGASRCVVGGVAAYANSVKQELLGVDPEVLASKGAVSPEVAIAMARGVRAQMRADIGLAITGIAGPSGGRPDKPVGTVDLAICDKAGEAHQRVVLSGSRCEVQEAAGIRGLGFLWQRLRDAGVWSQTEHLLQLRRDAPTNSG